MYRKFLCSILILFTFFVSSPGFSQDTGLSKVTTGSGLHKADFNIPEGIVTVYLPSDMTVSESASGSVSLKGNTAQTSINQIFSKYNLVVESQVVNIEGNNFIIQVPVNLPTGVLGVSLQDKQSRIISRAFFPVRLTKRSQLPLNAGGTGNFRTPVTSRAGMPALVNGPFDGNFQNSFISISGQPVVLLSESTRQLVFLIPDGTQGPKVLSLREGSTEFKTPFTVLHVVKVGRDNPALISRKDGTSTAVGSQGVLIESEKQFGKIDLEYNPDLGKTSREIIPVSPKKKYPPKEQPTLGPSIDDLSKPLELDPEELQKYSSPVQAKELSDNEFTSLKQFSDKPAVKTGTKITPSPKPKPVAASKQAAVPVKSGYADINEVKPLLDKQISSPFTPLEKADSKKATDAVTSKSKEEIKNKPVKTAAIKKEIKPVTTAANVSAKPIPPKIASPKPEVKAETNKEISSPKVSKVKQVKQPAPVSKAGPKSTNIKPAPKPSEYSSKMDDKAVKPPAVAKKAEPKDPKNKSKKNELSKTDSKTKASPGPDKNSYKNIKDLTSLNTINGSYQSLDKKPAEKAEEQIKEEKYVSLNKKETAKPEVKPAAVKGKFAIQLASFKKKSEAEGLVGKLNAGGYDVYYKRFKVPGKGYWYRVRKGGFSTRNEAEAYKSRLNLTKYHISSFFVTVED